MDEEITSPLFPWQRKLTVDVVDGPNKYIAFEKSRRIGGTWIAAIAAVLYCLKTGHNCWFTSSDEKNSKEFILYVKQFCEIYNTLLATTYIDLKEATTETVTLPNGSRISALSSNPKALRGKDGLLICDEIALHEAQEELYRAAQGCVVQRGKLLLLSTHNGPSLFHRLCGEAEQGKPDWSHHRVTLPDAVKEGYAKRFAPGVTDEQFLESVRRACVSDDGYGQEYLCKPLSIQNLISAIEYDRLALWDVPEELDVNQHYEDLFVGIDVGRVIDLSVCWVIERRENTKLVEGKNVPDWQDERDRYVYRTVAIKSLKNTSIPVQYAIFKNLLQHPSVQHICIDQTGLGRAMADMVQQEFEGICTGINFSTSSKARLAERLRGYVQGQRISLPKHDGIRTDLMSMRRLASASGWLSYDGRSTLGHCDHFWAAAMSLEAAEIALGSGAITVWPTPMKAKEAA